MLERIQDYVEVGAFNLMRQLTKAAQSVRHVQDCVESWFFTRRQRVTRLFLRD